MGLEERIFKEEDIDGVVSTDGIVVSDEIKKDMEKRLEKGEFRISGGEILHYDPELKELADSDTHEVNLRGGYFLVTSSDSLVQSQFVTLNLQQLAYLRQLVDWKSPATSY